MQYIPEKLNFVSENYIHAYQFLYNDTVLLPV